MQKNLDRAFKQIRDFGLDPLKNPIAIDADAVPSKLTWNSSTLPCLTRSRYKGHWVSNLRRRTSLMEMSRFQGMHPGYFKKTCSGNDLGRLLGNSMSLHVIERVLHAIFTTIGILSPSAVDRWKCLALSELLGLEHLPYGSRGGNVRIIAKIARRIVESGASDHIISRKHLTKKEMKSIRKAETSMQFQTANKTTETDDIVDYCASDLGITVTAWVVQDSPPLLSLGKLVEDFGVRYAWDYDNGAVIKIKDKIVHCSVNQRCPCVATSFSNPGVSQSIAYERGDANSEKVGASSTKKSFT